MRTLIIVLLEDPLSLVASVNKFVELVVFVVTSIEDTVDEKVEGDEEDDSVPDDKYVWDLEVEEYETAVSELE